MSEVDNIKKLIAEQRKRREDAEQRITSAIELVDRTRKEKRDKWSRPN